MFKIICEGLGKVNCLEIQDSSNLEMDDIFVDIEYEKVNIGAGNYVEYPIVLSVNVITDNKDLWISVIEDEYISAKEYLKRKILLALGVEI